MKNETHDGGAAGKANHRLAVKRTAASVAASTAVGEQHALERVARVNERELGIRGGDTHGIGEATAGVVDLKTLTRGRARVSRETLFEAELGVERAADVDGVAVLVVLACVDCMPVPSAVIVVCGGDKREL